MSSPAAIQNNGRHSAEVRMHLLLNGHRLPIAQLGPDFLILDQGIAHPSATAEISKATFGMTPTEYKDFKTLANPKENLQDHMTDLELIFTMLGEASTEIARKKDAQGFSPNQAAAKTGGAIAGSARQQLEAESGRRVSTAANFKTLPKSKSRKLGRGHKS